MKRVVILIFAEMEQYILKLLCSTQCLFDSKTQLPEKFSGALVKTLKYLKIF